MESLSSICNSFCYFHDQTATRLTGPLSLGQNAIYDFPGSHFHYQALYATERFARHLENARACSFHIPWVTRLTQELHLEYKHYHEFFFDCHEGYKERAENARSVLLQSSHIAWVALACVADVSFPFSRRGDRASERANERA